MAMDNNEALQAIRQNIRDEKNDIAAIQIMDLASKNQDDPMILLTCCSMLRTIGNDKDFPGVLSVLMSHIPSEEKIEVRGGYRTHRSRMSQGRRDDP